MDGPPQAPAMTLPSLTSLRWFAASAVFLLHSGMLLVNQQAQLDGRTGAQLVDGLFQRFSSQGGSGVSFFFILSGTVLTWSHRDPDDPWSFIRRRFARIYPAYVVTTIVTIAALAYGNIIGSATGFVLGVFTLTLLQAWHPATSTAGNPSSWSLSAEMFFYALFPMLRPRLDRLGLRGLLGVILGSMTVIVVAAFLVGDFNEERFPEWLMYFNPSIRVFEFVIGVCIGLCLRRGVRVRIPLWIVGAMSIAAYVIAGHFNLYLSGVVITLVPFSLLIATSASCDIEGRTPTLLRSQLTQDLGKWSYAFYLIHIAVLVVMNEVANRLDPDPSVQTLLVACAVSYVLATVVSRFVFRYVEVPLERRLRPSRQAVQTTAQAS